MILLLQRKHSCDLWEDMHPDESDRTVEQVKTRLLNVEHTGTYRVISQLDNGTVVTNTFWIKETTAYEVVDL